MERYSDVVGLPVICIESGKRIGIIKDIIFCPKSKKVLAFVLERNGRRIRKKVILVKDVLSLGNDAMVVNDGTCIKDLKEVDKTEEFKNKGEIRGLKIYSKAGEDLGIVEDVLFDCKTGTVEGVEASDGLFQDILKGRNIFPLFGKVEFGEENILVAEEAVEEKMNTGGGLKKKLFRGKE